jgi:hypothetical protein
MQLIPEFTWRVVANAATDIGVTDAGSRSHNEIPEIAVDGDRIKAPNRGIGGNRGTSKAN